MPLASVRGGRIYYELDGSGSRVLSISGSGQPGFLRGPHGLRERFEVLRYDHRGTGQTEEADSAFTMADIADDAAGVIDAVGWDRCAVFAASFGGMVAQELVLRHPPRVTRLVLACTSSGGAGGKSYPVETLRDLPADERAREFLARLDTRHDADWQQTHPDARRALLDQVARLIAALEPRAESRYRRLLAARAEHDTFARLSRIAIPVYVCGGRYDRIAPVSNVRALATQIPRSRLEFFEGGHAFIGEDARALEAIARFLAE